MTKQRPVVGWKLDRQDRATLLKDFPARYGEVVADHVTLKVGSAEPPADVRASIVGTTDDDQGVQAMVVSIDGTTDRPDGSVYHITWSLGPGRKAKESNNVLKERGWRELNHPIPINLGPARF